MNKDNIFKSSEFYMSEGDVLHMLFLDETGVSVTIDLVEAVDSVSQSGTAYDYDGNPYTYVTIGTQQWMVENLKTTHYADGTAIPYLTADADWIAEDGTSGHDGAYCWPNGDIANKDPYGAIYNWYAVNNAYGLAPDGWRIPTADDLTTLVNLLGGDTLAGGPLKETGTTHWLYPNDGATNSSGFTAVPAGRRNDDSGTFSLFGDVLDIWTSTEGSVAPTLDGVFRQLDYDNTTADPYDGRKQYGFSVRCVRDI